MHTFAHFSVARKGAVEVEMGFAEVQQSERGEPSHVAIEMLVPDYARISY